jgi:hypothetical protein
MALINVGPASCRPLSRPISRPAGCRPYARFCLAVRYWLRLGYAWRVAWDKARRA